MNIDISRFELCAFRQRLCSELRFERSQTIYFVGKKNEELEIIAGVGKANRGKSLTLHITEMTIHLSHHWNIDRRAFPDVERFRLRCLLRELIGPRGLLIKSLLQNKSRRLIKCAGGNEIANPVTGLIGDPFIDVLRGPGGIGSEIDWLKCRPVILFNKRQKSLAKIVSFLTKEPIGDTQRNRFARAAESFRLFYEFGRPRAHFFE